MALTMNLHFTVRFESKAKLVRGEENAHAMFYENEVHFLRLEAV